MWVCAALGVTILYVTSIPATAGWLHRRLATDSPIDLASAPSVQAILVLGGGRRSDTPEFGGDTLSPTTLERLRYAALLHKRTGLPVMVSGGGARDPGLSEAELMAAALRDEFGVPVRWMEGMSRDTFQNAQCSAGILQAAGIHTVALVTHALHMRRAAESFRKAGIDVVPAPLSFYRPSAGRQGLGHWLPSAVSVYQSTLAFHEIGGRLWYRWRYRENVA